MRIRVSEVECSVQNVKLESDRCSPRPLHCLASKLLQFPIALPWSRWQGPGCALVLQLAAEPTAGHLLGSFPPGKKVPLTGCLPHIAKSSMMTLFLNLDTSLVAVKKKKRVLTHCQSIQIILEHQKEEKISFATGP